MNCRAGAHRRPRKQSFKLHHCPAPYAGTPGSKYGISGSQTPPAPTPQCHPRFYPLLILRLALLLIRVPRIPTLRRRLPRLVLQRYLLSTSCTCSAIHLLLYVGSMLDVLVKSTDVAVDFVPGLEGEGDDGDLGRTVLVVSRMVERDGRTKQKVNHSLKSSALACRP